MPSVQIVDFTFVALVIRVFANHLTTEGEKKPKLADLHTMFRQNMVNIYRRRILQ